MWTKTHKDKNGKIITDLAKVKLPKDLEISIFKILNPSIKVTGREVKAQ